MIRKDFYLDSASNKDLKYISKNFGLSEGEVIRDALQQKIKWYLPVKRIKPGLNRLGQPASKIGRLYFNVLKKRTGNVCPRCKKRFTKQLYSKVRILRLNMVLHHKDRDETNNRFENLELLCTFCHAKLRIRKGESCR